MNSKFMTRRALIWGGAALGGGLATFGYNRLLTPPRFENLLHAAEYLTRGAQRTLLAGQPLAREFSTGDLSPNFKANGTIMPQDPDYLALAEGGFAAWRLQVDGLVAKPISLTLADLRALPQRTQITRHDCVEGWSAIGQWTGVPLAEILQRAELMPTARYIVFHCADTLGYGSRSGARYYESIDLFDAFHPQTILAHTMNGRPLEVKHGAPLRLRVERQLGYKHAKYLMRIEARDSFAGIGRGMGGYWEDRGYEWYAGI